MAVHRVALHPVSAVLLMTGTLFAMAAVVTVLALVLERPSADNVRVRATAAAAIMGMLAVGSCTLACCCGMDRAHTRVITTA